MKYIVVGFLLYFCVKKIAKNVRASFLSFGNKEKDILTIIDGMYRMLFSNIYLPDVSEDLKLSIAYFFCKIEGLLKGTRMKFVL